MPFNFHDYQDFFDLIPQDALIAPEASTKGTTGHGEGFSYGVKINSPRHYFYRFAGKAIPRDRISYVTCEDGYFSRERGDRCQLIVVWDEIFKGFRVLVDYTNDTGFMAEYKRIVEMGVEKAVEEIVAKRKKEKALAEQMQALLDSGVDLF
ncbi:hypothetical protein [Aeromonas veronii]|uniref:Uncharacterized protein n=1 Tax=Aeromonas veronii TaxID=654 RepID=A0A2T4MUK2_AERVE|nr:hypothetical protein [Aeromonas veronii]PTH78245.1 hypothetical protein DAA48_25930 [Aeromonas veronii]